MAYVGTNPTAPSTGRGTYVKTDTGLASTRGTHGNFLVINIDPNSSIGKSAANAPSYTTTVQTDPNAASKQFFTKQQMDQAYQTAIAMTSFISPVITGLGSLFSGLSGLGGGGSDDGESTSQASSKASKRCSGDSCGKKATQELAWNERGADSCPNGGCNRG